MQCAGQISARCKFVKDSEYNFSLANKFAFSVIKVRFYLRLHTCFVFEIQAN